MSETPPPTRLPDSRDAAVPLPDAVPSMQSPPTVAPDWNTVNPDVLPPTAAPWPLLPGYEVLDELSRGGMGVVYKARQVKLNRLVALKMILAGAHAGTQERARFRAEAEAVARLHHAHIVQIHEVGEHVGLPFCVLEFMEGGNLAARLRATPQPPLAAARLVAVLAGAVHAAHQAGIVHRDLKPANILLAIDGSPKVSDFGLAKHLDAAGQTVSGAVLGTPSYMAPEQARGHSKDVGPAADVYALGAILYEALTGRPPFLAESVVATLEQVAAADPVPPRRLNAKVPRDLETVCLKCLNKEPDRRYPTAEALARDLSHFLAGEPIEARPAGVVERTLRWVKRRPAAAALLVVSLAALVSLLGGGVLFTQQVRSERNLARVQGERAREQERRAREELERARRMLCTAQLGRVAAVWERDPLHGLDLLQDPLRCPADLRDFAWGVYHRLCRRHRLTLVGHRQPVKAAAFHPGGALLATAGGSFADKGKAVPGEIKLWDLATGRERLGLQLPGGEVTSLAFSPDGKTLASGSCSSTLRSGASATERPRPEGRSVTPGRPFRSRRQRRRNSRPPPRRPRRSLASRPAGSAR